MADALPQPVDFWSVLEEAEATVERWPEWQQRYDVDVYSVEQVSGRLDFSSIPQSTRSG